MKGKRRWLGLLMAPCMTAAAAAGQPADGDQLARFQQKVRQDMTGIPNYTCLETIERTRRAPPLRDFQPVDIVRLEVSSVGGKELFARPGGRFEDRELSSLLTSGTIGSGMFATFAHNLFVARKGRLKYKGRENGDGRHSVRYDFRLTQPESGFRLQVGSYAEMVAAKGSFWFDSVSDDLIRLEVHGADIPDSLHVDDAVVRISYARMHIGDSGALLPKRSELTMTYFSGVANRDAIEFSQCHEYRSESTISFDAPAARPTETAKAEPRALNPETAAPAPLPQDNTAGPEPPPNPVAAQAVTPSPNVVIRSSAREVLLDVVVRDTHGHLVNNLRPDEVAVYEDGVRQEVRAFRLVAGREVRIEDQKQAAEAEAAGPGPAVTGVARPPVNPLRTVNVVCLILNDLNSETRAFAFESARKFVNEELRPNTFIGVFSLDATGLRPVYPFSNSRERLVKAVELAAVDQLPSINLGSAAMFNGLSVALTGSALAGSPLAGAGAAGFADAADAKDPLGTRGEMGFSTNAGLREIDALTGLVRQLGSLPFQKTVVLFGTGFTKPPDLLEYWDSLIRRAVRRGVTFYAMDVYGLGVCQGDTDPDCVAHSAMGPSSALLPYVAALSKQQGPASVGQGASQASGPGAAAAHASEGPPPTTAAAQMMELAHQDDYLKFAVSSANRQEAIRELAERTGGFLIANTNNVDQLVARVMEEVDTHYEIAYPPKSEIDDGHFRRIEVKLARPGLQVETRGGYFALPDTDARPVTPAEMAGLHALDATPRPHAFDFLSRAYRFREAGGAAQYAVAFELPISNLTATQLEGAHKHRLHASLLALVKDARGQIVDRISKDVSSEVGDDHLAGVQVELMTYQHAVNLPPGGYSIETAVVDHESNRASTGVVRIDNREQPGVGLSDLTLVRRLENLGRPPDAADPFEYTGKRVLPFVTTNMYAGTIPFVYLRIYPEQGNPARPELRVRLMKDGQAVATMKPQLGTPDASGGIPMVLQLTGKPGSYAVRATVTQGNSSAERSLAYTIAEK